MSAQISKALRLSEDRDGLLNADGRLIAYDVRKANQFRAWGMTEVAADYQAEAERVARAVIVTARGGR